VDLEWGDVEAELAAVAELSASTSAAARHKGLAVCMAQH
jgi:hypothetical protein